VNHEDVKVKLVDANSPDIEEMNINNYQSLAPVRKDINES